MLPQIIARLERRSQPLRYYAEPFAGGAGAAIRLLSANKVDKIFLNDADVRIYAAWRSVLDETDRFIDKIKRTPLTVEVWREMRRVVAEPDSAESIFELGFATFYMNRTSRSGILIGSGPIGGYEQSGKWKVSARFYKETMIERVAWLGENASRISISNLDALAFIRSFQPRVAKRTFFFIDPPYVEMGSRLYFNSMDDDSHKVLAALIKRKTSMGDWIITYDDAPLIKRLYDFANVKDNEIRYSLQSKKIASELVIEPIDNS